MSRHAGFALAQLLMGYGVEYVFGVPGGQTLPLYEADYASRTALKHIVMRDERSAGHAACAYARVSGKVGVCDATVGPGATNLVSALGEALNSSTAMVTIVSDHPAGWTNYIDFGRASQGVDQMSVLGAVSKKAFRVPSPDRLPELVRAAFVEATTGRPGPVVLDIPADVFRQEWDFPDLDQYVDPECRRFPARRSAPSPDAVARAAQLLREAQRPVMIVGGGALISDAAAEVQELAEFVGMPVVTTFTGKGVLPDSHPLCLGIGGSMTGTGCAAKAVEAADLIFVVGSKSCQNSTYGWTFPKPTQRFVHLDVDPGEVGRVLRTDVGLVGDARLGLAGLLDELKRGGALDGPRDYLDWIHSIKDEWEARVRSRKASDGQPIDPARVVADLESALGADDLLVCDAGFASGWGGLYFSQGSVGRRCLFPRGLAGIGFAIAAGVGAQLAAPGRRVVTLGGDGASTYVMAELSTQARFNLPIVNVVLNNSSFGWVKWAQQAWYHGTFECSELGHIDFAKVAEGLGCTGYCVETPDALAETLKQALDLGSPVVVEVMTDPAATPSA